MAAMYIRFMIPAGTPDSNLPKSQVDTDGNNVTVYEREVFRKNDGSEYISKHDQISNAVKTRMQSTVAADANATEITQTIYDTDKTSGYTKIS